MHYSNQCAGLICCFPFSSQDPRFFGIGLLWSIGNVDKLCLLLGWTFFGRKILLWSERRRQLLMGCHYLPQGPGPENGEIDSEAAKKGLLNIPVLDSSHVRIGSRGELIRQFSGVRTRVWSSASVSALKRRLAIADRSAEFFRRHWRVSNNHAVLTEHWLIYFLSVDRLFEFYDFEEHFDFS